MTAEYKIWKKILFSGLLLFLFVWLGRVNAGASWVQNSDGTYSWYTSSGVLVKNQWIDNGNYYVNSKGVRVTGRNKINGSYYFFSKSSGQLIRGTWIKSGTSYYYAQDNGILCTGGRYKIGNYYYFFGSAGKRKTGLRKIGSKKYYFDDSSGRMVTKTWVPLNGKYYYFNKNGVMKKNKWVGSRYVGSDGASLTGLQTIDGKIYYFDPSTRKKITDTTKTINGVTYEFSSSGVGKVKEEDTSTPTDTRGTSKYSMESTYYSDPVVSDEELLAAIIYCEAGNQSSAGQLAVGLVILNRVRDSGFPNTFAEVIYQKSQFSPAADGSLTKALKGTTTVTAACRNAATAVMSYYNSNTTSYTVTYNGNSYEFSDYLFFCTPSAYVSNNLSASYITIGGHRFFKTWK